MPRCSSQHWDNRCFPPRVTPPCPAGKLPPTWVLHESHSYGHRHLGERAALTGRGKEARCLHRLHKVSVASLSCSARGPRAAVKGHCGRGLPVTCMTWDLQSTRGGQAVFQEQAAAQFLGAAAGSSPAVSRDFWVPASLCPPKSHPAAPNPCCQQQGEVQGRRW